jgi:hypothetical protein
VTKIRDWLKGKKTYIVCAVGILTVAVAWAEGNVTDGEAVEAVFKAIFGITIRAGVSKMF